MKPRFESQLDENGARDLGMATGIEYAGTFGEVLRYLGCTIPYLRHHELGTYLV